MTYRTIEFTNEGGIARLTLNRPERLNSFTVEMHGEVADALHRLGDARVLVLTGAGRGFCAGQDLNDRAVAPGETVDLGHSVESYYNPLIRKLTALPLPRSTHSRPDLLRPPPAGLPRSSAPSAAAGIAASTKSSICSVTRCANSE
jgi:1,4-dihydroxy-2-naphthoyl-CoA synthase